MYGSVYGLDSSILLTYLSILVCVLRHFSCVRLCHPTDCGPLGSSLHGILQARILKWVTMPEIEPESLTSPALANRFFTTSAVWEVPRLPLHQ